MCKSLGRNSDDTVMEDSFLCVFGSRGVKRTLGLSRKLGEKKSADHAKTFQTLREKASDQRSLIFGVQRAVWNK